MTGGRAAAAEPEKDRLALLGRHFPRGPEAVLPRNLHPARLAGLWLDQLLDRVELVNERLTRPSVRFLLGGLGAQSVIRPPAYDDHGQQGLPEERRLEHHSLLEVGEPSAVRNSEHVDCRVPHHGLPGITHRVIMCGRFSTLPAVSSAWASSLVMPSKVISHSAKLGATALASLPLTRTRLTVPLSAVVPRTTRSLPTWRTWVITVVGGRSSTGSSNFGKATPLTWVARVEVPVRPGSARNLFPSAATSWALLLNTFAV